MYEYRIIFLLDAMSRRWHMQAMFTFEYVS
jgi:hypothetical protein